MVVRAGLPVGVCGEGRAPSSTGLEPWKQESGAGQPQHCSLPITILTLTAGEENP